MQSFLSKPEPERVYSKLLTFSWLLRSNLKVSHLLSEMSGRLRIASRIYSFLQHSTMWWSHKLTSVVISNFLQRVCLFGLIFYWQRHASLLCQILIVWPIWRLTCSIYKIDRLCVVLSLETFLPMTFYYSFPMRWRQKFIWIVPSNSFKCTSFLGWSFLGRSHATLL